MVLDKQLCDQFMIACGRSVGDRLEDEPPIPQPPRGMPVDRSSPVRVIQGELRAGELGEQRMDAIPAASFQSLHHQVLLFELGERIRRVVASEYRVTELRREPAEDAGREEEGAPSPVERIEDLGGEIVGHETVIAVELMNGLDRIVEALEPQARKHHGRGPALGPLEEDIDLLLADREALTRDEKLAHLVARECKLGRAQLDQRSGGPHPPDGQRWIDPADQDQAHVRRQVGDRVLERAQTLVARHRVKVVQHDHERTTKRRCAVQELVHGLLDGRRHIVKPLQGRASEALPDAVDRRRDIPPHLRGIVVAFLQRDPRQCNIDARAPLPHRRCLAVSGRSYDECERIVSLTVERCA